GQRGGRISGEHADDRGERGAGRDNRRRHPERDPGAAGDDGHRRDHEPGSHRLTVGDRRLPGKFSPLAAVVSYPVSGVSDANLAATELARAYLSRFLTVYAQRRRLSPGTSFGPTSEEIAVALGGRVPLDHDPGKDHEVAAALTRLKQLL